VGVADSLAAGHERAAGAGMSAGARPLLIIGNKNYSSWSLRAWLLLRVGDVPFDELQLPLDTPEFAARIAQLAPNRRVPALHDGAVHIWDSLAIAEYANERWLAGRGWPADAHARAVARAISAEMHSGFTALRRELPFNCSKRASGCRLGDDAAVDVARVLAIWDDARCRFGTGGDFLFGGFCIADAMYAPVALRFVSHGVPLDGVARAYVDALLALEPLREWLAAAATEDKSDRHERMLP
jgi:glutathione S-transferase